MSDKSPYLSRYFPLNGGFRYFPVLKEWRYDFIFLTISYNNLFK